MFEYVLHKKTDSDIILQNKEIGDMYVILTKTGFANGSLDFVTDSKTPKSLGFWFLEPEFSNGKSINY